MQHDAIHLPSWLDLNTTRVSKVETHPQSSVPRHQTIEDNYYHPHVKRYLHKVFIVHDGMLAVKETLPLQPTRELIVIPHLVICGLLTALHIKFNHPSMTQTKKLVSRFFFELDMDKAIDSVVSSCHHCAAIMKVPWWAKEQSSE